MYGHIASLAKSVAKGVTAAGGSADLFQIPETLPGKQSITYKVKSYVSRNANSDIPNV
jgi:multimeric flavodoxin WrbA